MRIERATSVSDELLDALECLLPQLSPGSVRPAREDIADMLRREDTYLLMARAEEGGYAGTLTLVLYRTPQRLEATIQSVVVDDAARGQGIGEALTREAIRLAVDGGVSRIRLTSRHDRKAAHRLYERLGFRLHETNVYVWRPG